MTVYIDDMYLHPQGRFGRMKMSHMAADTEGELHEMAAKIGMQRRWYQGDHYDVCMSRRDQAIKHGAVEISMRELAAFCWHKKTIGFSTDPEIALEKMQASMRAKRETVPC